MCIKEKIYADYIFGELNLIRDYEIVKQEGEEVLYVYLDFDMEFAKLGSKGKKKKIDEIVRDFLSKHDISFAGQKVAIISGGLLVATLMLKAPNMNYNNVHNFDSVPKICLVDNEIPERTDSPMEYVDNHEKLETEEQGSKTQETPSASQAVKPSPSSKVEKPSSSGTSTSTKPSSSNQRPPTQEKKPDIQEEVTDNSVYVSLKRASGEVLKIELEKYVVGVVGAEMPASFDKEALKAQAVIARTYALRASERGQVLTDNSSTQNYKSDAQLRAMWGTSYNTYLKKIESAVEETRGVYLIYNNVIIDAVYHSTSNGRTENAEYVWGNAFPYLVSVESPYDTGNPSFEHSVHLKYEEVAAKLGLTAEDAKDISILERTTGNRVLKVTFGGREFSGVTVRNKLGLRSADFNCILDEEGITFTTRGYGHGVGLSQYGANGMAKNGFDWQSILKHYYRGVNISHL